MNIKKAIQVSAISFATAAAVTFAPISQAADRDTTTEESRGAVIGGVVGALVGGPFGAGVGAIVGGGVIGKLVGEQRVNDELSLELASAEQQLVQTEQFYAMERAGLNSEVDRLTAELHQLVELRTAMIKARDLPIQYKTGSSEIEGFYQEQLGYLAKVLKQNQGTQIALKGYADRRGDETYNQELSEARVKGVKDYLLSQGVTAAQISTEAFGESAPLAEDENLENHFFDRRVVMELKRADYNTSTAAR